MENKENKYYIPDITEVYVGYELELMTSDKGWVQGKFPEVLDKNHELDQFTDPFIKLAHAIVRTRYLDQSDIEQCGWNWDGDKDYGQKFYKTIDNKYYILYTEWGDINITISEYRPNSDVVPSNYSTLFQGNCPSINELRTIMKLIGI